MRCSYRLTAFGLLFEVAKGLDQPPETVEVQFEVNVGDDDVVPDVLDKVTDEVEVFAAAVSQDAVMELKPDAVGVLFKEEKQVLVLHVLKAHHQHADDVVRRHEGQHVVELGIAADGQVHPALGEGAPRTLAFLPRPGNFRLKGVILRAGRQHERLLVLQDIKGGVEIEHHAQNLDEGGIEVVPALELLTEVEENGQSPALAHIERIPLVIEQLVADSFFNHRTVGSASGRDFPLLRAHFVPPDVSSRSWYPYTLRGGS